LLGGVENKRFPVFYFMRKAASEDGAGTILGTGGLHFAFFRASAKAEEIMSADLFLTDSKAWE